MDEKFILYIETESDVDELPEDADIFMVESDVQNVSMNDVLYFDMA